MSGLLCRAALLGVAAGGLLYADGPGRIESMHVARDFKLSLDPSAKPWRLATPVVTDKGPVNEPEPAHRTEIRSVWSNSTLYLLFVCPYEELYLIEHPSTTTETNRLWEHDVTEVFIGSDFKNINRYKEIQVSPQGEWVDLDIDREHPLPEGGWRWNSGFKVAARIDHARKIWYGAMAIPFKAIDTRPAVMAGNDFRINIYRLQGPPDKKVYIAWQPTGARNYHLPQAFGRLILVDPKK
jgi:hypothetical protein